MRSLENPGKSKDMDMPRDPEGIYGRDKKEDEPLSFEEHMREYNRLKDLMEDLSLDDSSENIKQNEEKLNESRYLNSIGDSAEQETMDKRVEGILRGMDEVGSFGRQYRNPTDEERREEIERAREKVLESFKESFNNNNNDSVNRNIVDDSQINHSPVVDEEKKLYNDIGPVNRNIVDDSQINHSPVVDEENKLYNDIGPVNRNIVDDSQINHSPVVDEENKPQMDYISITDFSKKEPINMPSLELEEPVSSMEKASPEDEAAYHEFKMEQILGQFFPKTNKHETIVDHREPSAASENLAGSLASNEKSDVDLVNNEKTTDEGYLEKEQVEQLKAQLSNCNSQIEELMANIQPYMQIPKVNREISKVIKKNNDINSSQTIHSVSDYKTVIEAKQSLIAYLEQANRFIENNVGKTQEPAIER